MVKFHNLSELNDLILMGYKFKESLISKTKNRKLAQSQGSIMIKRRVFAQSMVG